MRLWQNQTGHLECRWSEAGQRVAYQATWMKEASEASGTYIPPIPDFASHSPFGGTVSWFLLHASKAKEKGNHHQQRTESDKSFCQLFCLSTVSSNEAQHTSTETSSSQLCKLRRNLYATDKNIFALFLFQFKYFVAQARANNSRFFPSALSNDREKTITSDPATWIIALLCSFVVIGIGGFLLPMLSSVGPLRLPASYEWPAGYVRGVARTADGKYVVPLVAYGRVQIYDSRWHFLQGWNVDAKGGGFRVQTSPDGVIEVFFLRGDISHRSYTEEGELLPPKDPQDPYRVAPRSGQSMIVPAAAVFWVFSSPCISILLAIIGFAGLAAMRACR
jgi:hypothetical protein